MTRRIPISAAIDQKVRAAAKYRCGYCLSPQSLVMARLEIEHIIPLSKGGSNTEENLWLACPLCNSHKASKVEALDPQTQNIVPLFNPRQQNWSDHFEWSTDGLKILGKTSVGRATVIALCLSEDPDALIVRTYWVKAGWHPPKE